MSGVSGCNSEVSAMRESTVYVREIQTCLLKKMLNVRYCLSVIVRENRAEAKDRGRRLTSTFLPYKSHLKRLSTVVFSEVGGFFILR